MEHRAASDPLDVFAAIGEAMTAARDELAAHAEGGRPVRHPPRGRDAAGGPRRAEGRRADGGRRLRRLAPWPALEQKATASADAALLRGLPALKTQVTWVPWTHDRLASASGYGAGVPSPGWYAHVWAAPDQVATRWVARVAALLRKADIGAWTASVVETVRLAETLAALRDRAVPGLDDLMGACESVLCEGNAVPLKLVERELVIGDVLGEVGPDVPTTPVQSDFEARCRSLRMKPAPGDVTLVLDLRKENDRERSTLLHRLRLLGVPWGTPERARSSGTFAEGWRLRWDPRFVVNLVEANRFGTTVASAAAGTVTDGVRDQQHLPAVTDLLERVVLADLPQALAAVTAVLEHLSALTGDVRHLLESVPALARVLRYGDVRNTDTALVGQVLAAIWLRACAGLAQACSQLDEEAAAAMAAAVTGADAAITLVGGAASGPPGGAPCGGSPTSRAWSAPPPRCRSRASRRACCSTRPMPRATPCWPGRRSPSGCRPSSPTAPRRGRGDLARGVLAGSGLVLLRDDTLWSLLDRWLAELRGEDFDDVVPLLRRAFARFPGPERRQMGDRARTPRGAALQVAVAEQIDWDGARVALVLPGLLQVLGRGVTS